MLHMIIGTIAIVVGLRGIVANWYLFLDILGATVPLGLIGFGAVALLAGIRHVKRT